MAHGAVMVSNENRARRVAAARKSNHRIVGCALRRMAMQIHRAAAEGAAPPFGLIEGGFRRL